MRTPSARTYASYKPNERDGLCHCGCGEKAPLAFRSDPRRGYLRGKPKRFIKGHWSRLVPRGKDHWAWRGGKYIMNGYVVVRLPSDHPMATAYGRCFEHRLVMANHLGRPVRREETVHHINGNRRDNRIENLQIRIGNHGAGASHVCLDCGSHNIQAEEL